MRTRALIAVIVGMCLWTLPLRANPSKTSAGGAPAAAAGDASVDDSAYTDSAAADDGGSAAADEEDTVDARPKHKPAPSGDGGLLKIKLFNDAAGTLSMDGEEIGKIQANVDEPYVVRGVSAGRHHLKLVTDDDKVILHEVMMHAGHNKVVRIQSQAAEAGDDSGQAPARHAKRRARESIQPERSYEGAKTACTILDWTGWGFFIVGLAYAGTGMQDEQNGQDKYLNHPGWASDGNYYGYEIDGRYYTADEYATYVKGEGEVETGAYCIGIGAVCWIVEICIPTHARNPQGSLMNIEDKQVAFAVPDITFDPRQEKYQATLLSAKF
ncbi:MAG TPA: hypothetical protein VNZ67_09560 [bacterium]|jgi:hypothetical protein|nr:hypothetical protein [bacterium]